jgi:transcriptional/translational regulatory protein YebC/TACO1
MAGHSKWANIQHRKGAQDAKRGKVFTKLIREITVSARMGGPDPASNPRLRLAVDKALGQNMPKDTIERAIKRGAGALEGENFEEVRYEGYGPGGVAVMVDCMTDNRVRTVADVRQAGLMSFPAGTDEDRVIEVGLEAGADDVVSNDDGSIDVFTAPEQFEAVKQAMEEAHLVPAEAEITLYASTDAPLSDVDEAKKMVRLLEMLEDLDDVQHVYSNADIPDAVMAELG